MARLLVFILLSWWHALALSQQPLLQHQMGFLQDPRAQLSIEQIHSSEFKPYAGSLGLGFVQGAVWTRLIIDTARTGLDDDPPRLVVRVGPNYLEQIELYSPTTSGWIRQLGGSLRPEASRHCPDDMHCFVIDTPDTPTTTIYLRLEHRGFLNALIEVLPESALPAAVAGRVRNVTVSMAIALGLLTLGIALMLIDRSLLMLVYCGFQLTIVLFIASNAGLVAVLLPNADPEALNLFNHLLYVVRVTLTGLLAWSILKPHRPVRLYHAGAAAMLIVCVINCLLVIAGHPQIALKGNLLVFSILPFWQLFGTLSARDFPGPQRRVMLFGISIYVAMLVLGLWLNFTNLPLIPEFGLIRQIVDWRLNGFAVGILFLWITLLERSAQKRAQTRALEALRSQAEESKRRQAEFDERSALVDMLTHELKNPLGTIRFALASLRQQVPGNREALARIQNINASAQRMDDLIERVASFSKIERATPTDSPASLDAASLIQELLADMATPEQWSIDVQPGASFRCDRQMLWVILENLMTNASKYSVPDHMIDVKVTISEPEPSASRTAAPHTATRLAHFEVSNLVDPACVPDEASLFDRYYRHPNVQHRAGMGLGLDRRKTAL